MKAIEIKELIQKRIMQWKKIYESCKQSANYVRLVEIQAKLEELKRLQEMIENAEQTR